MIDCYVQTLAKILGSLINNHSFSKKSIHSLGNTHSGGTTSDFTDGEASRHKFYSTGSLQHFLQCAQAVLDKHYEKLIQSDARLNFLSQQQDVGIIDRSFWFQTAVEMAQQAISAAHKTGMRLSGGAEGAGQNIIPRNDSQKQEKDESGNPVFLDVGAWLNSELNKWWTRDHKGELFTVKYIDPTYMIRAVTANATDNLWLTEDELWWGKGSPNIEMDKHTLLVNRERAVDYLCSLDKVYVNDQFLNWDPVNRINVRIVSARAYHSLFMHNILQAKETLESLLKFSLQVRDLCYLQGDNVKRV